MGTAFPIYDTPSSTSTSAPRINTTAPGSLAPRTVRPALGTPGNPIILNPTPVNSGRAPTPARVTSTPSPRPNVTAGVTARTGRQTAGRAGGWAGAKAAAGKAAARAGTGVAITQADSPLPGPADVVGGVVVVSSGVQLAVDLWQLYRGLQPQPTESPNDVQNVGEPAFEGGQCPGILYTVETVLYRENYSNGNKFYTNFPIGNIKGPVGNPFPSETRPHPSTGQPSVFAYDWVTGDGRVLFRREGSSVGILDVQVVRVTRSDGLPDDCGNPQGEPVTAPPEVGTRQRPGSPFAPTIRSQPGRPGLPYPTPQPQPQPGADGQPGTDGQPYPYPDPYPTPNPGPTPTPGPRTDPTPDTQPPNQPSEPDTPNEPEPEESGCDPCAKIDELTELLREALTQGGGGSVALPPCEDEEEENANNSP